MKANFIYFLFIFFLILFLSCNEKESVTNLDRYDLSSPPTHDNAKDTEPFIRLGAELYFLGENSCASCHKPEKGYTAIGRQSCGSGCEENPNGRRIPIEADADFPPLSSLSSVGNIWKKEILWSGLAGAKGHVHIEGSKEYFNGYGMPGCWTQILIAQDSGAHNMLVDFRKLIYEDWDYYRPLFKACYPNVSDEMLVDDIIIADAIDAFQDVALNPIDSKFQKFIKGEVQLTASELRGHYIMRTKCETNQSGIGCHLPPLFESNNYYNLGFPNLINYNHKGDNKANFGHFTVSKDSVDIGAMRVSQLVQSATFDQYGHGGNIPNLETAIIYHNRKQKIFEIDKGEIIDVIEFIKTLTDSTLLKKPEFVR